MEKARTLENNVIYLSPYIDEEGEDFMQVAVFIERKLYGCKYAKDVPSDLKEAIISDVKKKCGIDDVEVEEIEKELFDELRKEYQIE